MQHFSQRWKKKLNVTDIRYILVIWSKEKRNTIEFQVTRFKLDISNYNLRLIGQNIKETQEYSKRIKGNKIQLC